MLLHMLRWMVGDNAFFTGMKTYLNDPLLKNGFAYTTDFKTHMEQASGRNLTKFFADWYYGQGFPTYTVNVSHALDGPSAVTIYQSQSDTTVKFFELPVPIKFFGGGKDTTMVFNHTFSGQVFNVNPGFSIDSIQFDPEQWLISANNSVSLGKDDLPSGKILTLLPNPAKDFLYVQHNLGKIKSMKIISMDGRSEPVVFDNKENARIKINIHNLKPAMYCLRIDYTDGTITRNFIVER